MAILLIDGPEKAGKTTLIQMMQRLESKLEVRKWYQPKNYGEYYKALLEDIEKPFVVWDRGWPSDAVYSRLMPNWPRRFPANPDWAEDRLGKPLVTRGVRLILLGPDPEQLQARRTPDDLPVNPRAEQLAYLMYARKYGYLTCREAGPTLANAMLDLMTTQDVGNIMYGHLEP